MCLIDIYSVLFCSITHRQLRSFPTRRSSDLSIAKRRGANWRKPASAGSPSARVCSRCCARRSSAKRRRRSEEHTSELQSRENLVCRLLLEKKKQQGSCGDKNPPAAQHDIEYT